MATARLDLRLNEEIKSEGGEGSGFAGTEELD